MSLLSLAMPRRAAASSLSSLSGEIWLAPRECIEALMSEATSALASASASEIRAFLRDHEPAGPSYAVDEVGRAHVSIAGPMMRRVPWVLDLFGIEAASTDSIRAAIAAADADPDVQSIVLHIDSPGGTVSGTTELADAVFAASKPVHAHGSGMVASAAYWVASQADRLTADPSTTVGSIGAYATIEDSSKALADEGIKVHVLRSGEHKGAGAGDEVTASQLSHLQSTVDAAAGMFLAAVARSREIDGLSDLADGRAWFAADAAALGLIDGAESVEAAVAAATPDGEIMNEEQIKALIAQATEPLAADLAESLKALDEARGRVEAAESRAQAAEEARRVAEEASKAQAQSRIDAAVAGGVASGRVTAENKALVDAFVAAVPDPVKVEQFIGGLAPQTRPDAQGALPPAGAKVTTSDQQKVATLFGVSAELLAACETNVSWVPGKGFKTKDGRIVQSIGEVN